jgi:hypothetical protein
MNWEQQFKALESQKATQDAQLEEVNDLLNTLEQDVTLPVPVATLAEFEEACAPKAPAIFIKSNF